MNLILQMLSYPRSILGALFAVFWTLICSVIVIAIIIFTGRKEKAAFAISQIWAKVILKFSGVEVEVRGAEKMPSGGCLYLFNHTSHYDILVIFAHSPRFCYFGAKSELFSIPVFGSAIRKAGALPIERRNREKVMQVYKDAEKRVKQGDVFALAPEGTRCDGRGKLGEFKSGPFFFAVNTQMPLVPLVLIGCENVLAKKAILVNWGVWKQKVIMEILDPIYPQGLSEEQVPFLKQKVRQEMTDCLQKHWS
jgi:1-acyl-sn-glycerol-3-phosphate acyltransferase